MTKDRPVDNPSSIKETRDALIALAATEHPRTDGDPPSDEEIAALVEQRLSFDARAKALEKLDRNPQAYNEWLALAALHEQQFTAGHAVSMLKPAKPDRRLWRWPWASAGLAAGVVLFFAWLGLRPGEGIESLLRENDQEIAEMLQSRPDPIALPWDSGPMNYGLSGPGAIQPFQRAFGAGLWVGRQTLLGQQARTGLPDFLTPEGKPIANPVNAWSTGAWANYYYLGAWAMALRTACQPGRKPSTGFWRRQLSILSYFESNLADPGLALSVTKYIKKRLAGLRGFIEKAIESDSDSNPCRDLNPELNLLIANASPPGWPTEQKP